MVLRGEDREVILMGMFGHGWGMMAGMFLFWTLVVVAGLWLLTCLFPAARAPLARGDGVRAGATDTVVQVVRQRYASGEISKSEYEIVLRTLEGTAPAVGDSSQQV